MQFLAFLKDSFREARSGWVLQAMLVLAFLLVLFVFSISFTPTTVKGELDTSLGLMNRLFRTNPDFAGASFSVENYSETNPAVPWQSDYAFDFVVRASSPEGLKKIQDNRGLPASRSRVERFMRDGLSYLDNIRVEKGPEAPNELRFRVTTQGTKTPDVAAWRHVPRVLFAFDAPLFTTSLRGGVYFMEKYLINRVGAWVLLAISVVISAAFIPNLLQKGAFDLAVSKPISRPLLLVYKYVGGLSFTVVLTVFTVVGAYAAIGLRTGMWNHNFLLAVPILTLYFAVLYAVSVLAAVLTRSTIVAILAGALAWGVFYGVGIVNDRVEDRLEAEAKQARNEPQAPPKPPEPGEVPDPDEVIRRIDPDAPLWGFIPKSLFPVVRAVHFVTPRTFQLDSRLERLIAEGVLTEAELKESGYGDPPRESWAEMIGVSLGFIAVVLGLACWRFATRDG